MQGEFAQTNSPGGVFAGTFSLPSEAELSLRLALVVLATKNLQIRELIASSEGQGVLVVEFELGTCIAALTARALVFAAVAGLL